MFNAKNSKIKEIKGFREIKGILILTLGFLIFLGMLSYNPLEISYFTNNTSSFNWIGLFGAYTSFILLFWFGVAAYIVPICIMTIGISSMFWSSSKIYPRVLWFILALFCLSGLSDMSTQIWMPFVDKYETGTPGGLIGNMLAHRTIGLIIGKTGAVIIFFVLFIIAIARMLEIQVITLIEKLFLWIKNLKREEINNLVNEKTKITKKIISSKKNKEPSDNLFLEAEVIEDLPKKVNKTPSKEKLKKESKSVKKDISKQEDSLKVLDNTGMIYQKPSLKLLDPSVKQEKGMTASQVTDTAKILQDALEEFGVEAKVTGVQQGPVVTCYEILPSAGVRVERIKALADNIALKMHAKSIRIQAPIPGKGVCGVEVPNISRSGVFFRDIVEQADFSSAKYDLPLILGKDVSGESLILDLAKMPHMLIAGATGAGKSVCMNTILTGLLMKYSPEDLRLILVDPKTVEFHTYNDLPHLVVPVITNAKKVSLGLKWVIDEMERRFRYFNQANVRDLNGYNNRVISTQDELFEEDIHIEKEKEEKEIIPDHLPFIVVVIDELADLMAVAQAEIEASIARLAAKSRAAGIHMILATQRPDVKVITGTIKANFPARVAFKVSQKVDSRTILDRMGADALLGKGDMLVLPPGSDKLIRLQGAFTSDGEIERVTAFWKDQGKPDFIKEIKEKIEKPVIDLPDIDDSEDEEMVEQALEVIRQSKRASTSSLQRRLRIGYTRAARIMDLLEERGIIGPPDGAGPREILIDLDGEIPQNMEIDNETDST